MSDLDKIEEHADDESGECEDDTLDQTFQHINLRDKYRALVEYGNLFFPYRLTRVLQMGFPVINPYVPTALVFWNKDEQRIEFHMSPKVLRLPIPELFMTIAHETMHVTLHHPDILPKMFEDHDRANVVSDLQINDYLEDLGLEGPEWILRGTPTIGQNCARLTLTEINRRLSEEKMEEMRTSRAMSGARCGQSLSPEDIERIQKYLEKHPELISIGGPGSGGGTSIPFTDKMKEIYDKKMKEAFGDEGEQQSLNRISSNQSSGPLAGVGVNTQLVQWSQQTGTDLRWVQLLRELDPNMFPEAGQAPAPPLDFHRKNRKLYGKAYEKIHLPVVANREGKTLKRTPEKPFMVLALDTSGSISPETAQRFITIAESVPQKFVKLAVCTFTDRFMELDLDYPQWVSGGTCFSAIEEFIQFKMQEERRMEYPKAVVVATDGYAAFDRIAPDEKYWDNWLWLLADDHQRGTITESRKIGRIEELEDYVLIR